MRPTPVIHGVSASPFVRKTRVFLYEKGVEHAVEAVMPFAVGDDFRRISPLGKVPVYQEGDFTVPDSSVICAYLERVHPDPPLYPAEAHDYARALWFEEYADTKLVESLGPVFFQRVVRARIFRQEPDEKAVEQALRELVPPVLDYLEGVVGAGDGIVGGRFGIADAALGSPFVNLAHAGEGVDAARWPALAAYLDRIHARPSFRDLIAEEKAAFASV